VASFCFHLPRGTKAWRCRTFLTTVERFKLNGAYLDPTLPRLTSASGPRAGSLARLTSIYIGAKRNPTRPSHTQITKPELGRYGSFRRSAEPFRPQLTRMAAERDRYPVRGVATYGSLRQDTLQCSAIDPQLLGEARNALPTSPRATTQLQHKRRGVIPSPAAWTNGLSHGERQVHRRSAPPPSPTVRSPSAAMRR
jgi:hypothetical protein